MLENLPSYIPISFILISLATLALFYHVLAKSSISARLIRQIMAGMIVWLGVQAALSLSGFYAENPNAMPPRFLLTFLPALLFIIYTFNTTKGKAFIDKLSMAPMTYLHVIRIPVEIVLYWLALQHVIPELMTFAGRNFDILAGITGPIVAYYGISQGKMGNQALLVWNFIALGLLFFIVGNAILSAPFPFQQFAFDQPNIAVLYFPFAWLPAFVVPVVMFCHFASIRQLLYTKEKAAQVEAV